MNQNRLIIVDENQQGDNTPYIEQAGNGSPQIVLSPNSKWPIRFPLYKVKVMVKHVSSIQGFVDSGGTTVPDLLFEDDVEKPTLGSYENNILIVLDPSSKYPVSFGLSKAKAILANLDILNKFVESNGTQI